MSKPRHKQEQSPGDSEPQGSSVAAPPPPFILTVLRVMPSGRHVLCSDGQRQDLVCYVRNALHFRKGMHIIDPQPDPSDSSGRLWRHLGPLPRKLGVW